MERGLVEGRETGGGPPRHFSSLEDRLRIATRAAAIGIWEWDLPTGQMVFSRVGREIFGFGPDEPITIDMVRAVTHPEDLPRTSAMARRATDPAVRENAVYR
jgi:PAS domain-containing protein